MKKYNYLFILFLINISCNKQDDHLQRAKSDLKQSIEIMQSALDFNNEPDIYDPAIPINPSTKSNSQKKSDSLLIKMKNAKYLDSIFFTEKIDYPSNYLELDYDKGNFGLIRGNKNYYYQHNDEEPIFLLEKVIYRDKTSQVLADTIDYGAQTNLYKGIVFNSPKPIKQLKVKVIYKYPQVKKISLRKDKLSIVLPEGEIKLKKLVNNTVQFIIPINSREKLIDAIAYDIDGQPIEKEGYSYKNSLTENQITFLEKAIPVQKTAIEKLNNNEFKNIDELDNYIYDESPAELNENSTKFIATYNFKDNIAYVDLFFQKGNKVYTEQNITIENNNYNKTRLNFFKATDTISKKQGFLGLDGKWIKPPVFNGLRYENDYYYSAYVNDTAVLFRLNPKENSFDSVDYWLDEYELFHGNLAIIKNENGDQGVINAETNKMMLSFKYNYLINDNGIFIVKNKKNKYGAYDANLKQLLPEIYSYLSVTENEIHTNLIIDGKPNKKEVFNLKGTRIRNKD